MIREDDFLHTDKGLVQFWTKVCNYIEILDEVRQLFFNRNLLGSYFLLHINNIQNLFDNVLLGHPELNSTH